MQTPSKEPLASVVVSTRNRSSDLLRAVESALMQDVPLEVIVLDDASDDGTSAAVRDRFREVRLFRSERSRGYIWQRNRGARLASAPYIVSIDDDACFSSSGVVREVLGEFGNPRVGAVAIPHVDVIRSTMPVRKAPAGRDEWVVEAFVGTAYAVSRSLFLALGGFREMLYHQGEERDFCLRMLESGYVTKLGRGSAILHFESPRRDRARMTYYARRNDMLWCWHNVPLRHLVPNLGGSMWNGLAAGVRYGDLRVAIKGVMRGLGDIAGELKMRKAVSVRTYELSRRLRKRMLRLGEIECELPVRLEY